jgi:GTPase
MNKNSKKLPLVVIFGRTNVGKSTLFNRLIETRQALVSDIPGTTRDSNSNLVHWNGFIFQLVDTGGILKPTQEVMFKKQKGIAPAATVDDIDLKVQKQAVGYLKLADLVFFIVDNKTGLLPQDRQMANLLRTNLPLEQRKKIILVANKVDSAADAPEAEEFKKLGFGEPITVSATTGAGTGDLLEAATKFLRKAKLAKRDKNQDEEKGISVCILGKPNVGKSSLLNALLGYEKVIVSPIPHTTREPQNTEIVYKDKKIILIDTAGISKHGHKGENLEKYGIQKTIFALVKSDIVLFVIDMSEEITHQDAAIIEKIVEAGKSLIIIANKWDLVELRDTEKYKEDIYYHFPFANWAPVQFVSAKTGEKVQKIMDLILGMAAARHIQVSDSQLNHFLSRIVKIHLPAKAAGTKPPHIYDIKQIRSNPPLFSVRIGAYDSLHFSYLRFIKNKLREQFKIFGVPIKIRVENNPHIHGQAGLPRNSKKRPKPGKPAAVPRGYRPGRRK